VPDPFSFIAAPRCVKINAVEASCLHVPLLIARLPFLSVRDLESRRGLVRKSMTEKASKSNPIDEIRQHNQGVYFLNH
jgi:hypothetical protein